LNNLLIKNTKVRLFIPL